MPPRGGSPTVSACAPPSPSPPPPRPPRPAASAQAWSVSATENAGGTASFVAAPGEVNARSSRTSAGSWSASAIPSGPAGAGTHCSRRTTRAWPCADGRTSSKLYLGDRNDNVLVGQEVKYAPVNIAGEAATTPSATRARRARSAAATGTDILRPGLGKDTVVGGPGLDAIDYSERTTPISISLGEHGQAIQGAKDEGDVMKEIEVAFTGTGNDTLTGWTQPQQFIPGPGQDTVDTGGGDDKVDARDGFKDTITCSAVGAETVYADQLDVVSKECDTVAVKHTLLGGNGGVKDVPPTPKDLPGEFEQPAAPPASPAGPAPAAQPATPPVAAPFVAASPGPNAEGSQRDRTAPLLRSVRLDRRVIRRTGAPKGRATVLRFATSEPSTVAVTVERCAATRRTTRRCALPTRVARLTRRGLAGRAAIRMTAELPGRTLRPGRYRLTLRATDAAGNRSPAVTTRLDVRR
jgi:hypothetical protein